MKQKPKHNRKPPGRPPLDNGQQITLRLPGALLAEVESHAVEAWCPRSATLRRLIARGLEKEKAS